MGAAPNLDFLSLLAEYQSEFLTSLRDADPEASVPACGNWMVRDLVEHIAFVHHWAAAQARDEKASPLGDGPLDLVEHYAACASEIRETLRVLDPRQPARILGHPGPLMDGTVLFWHRRQVHETLIHLHDLRASIVGKAALGLAHAAPEVWADAVDEVVTMFQPRQVKMGRMAPLRIPLGLVAADVAGAPGWVLGGTGQSIDEVRSRVSGSAEGLALLLWGRLTLEEAGVTVLGDRAEVDEVLSEPIVP